eukprot:6561689-Prymnesium_polylepis.2
MPEGGKLFTNGLLPLLQTRQAHAIRAQPLLRFGKRSNIKHGKYAFAVNTEQAQVSSMKLWVLNMTQYEAILFLDLDALPLAVPERTDPFAALLRKQHTKLLGLRGPAAPIAGSAWVVRPDRAVFEDLLRVVHEGFTPERGWGDAGRFSLTGFFERGAWRSKDCSFWADEVGETDACGASPAEDARPRLPWSFWAAEADNGLLFWLFALRAEAGSKSETAAFNPHLDEYLEVAHFTQQRIPWKPTSFFNSLASLREASVKKTRHHEPPESFRARKRARVERDRWCSAGRRWWDRWRDDVSPALICGDNLPCVAELDALFKRQVAARLQELCPLIRNETAVAIGIARCVCFTACF